MDDSLVDDRGSVFLFQRTDSLRLEASYARAFDKLGRRTHLFEPDPDDADLQWWLRTRIGRRITRRSLQLRGRGARRRNEAVVRDAREIEPRLVFIVKGQFLTPATVSSLKDVAGSVAVLHPDAPFPENPNFRPEHFAIAAEADVNFIWSRRLKARLEEEGVRKAVYLPFAWDPEVYPHVEADGRDGPEVVFVGGWDRYRERWLEPVAERFELEIWGPDYWGTRTRRGSAVRECWQGRALRGREAAVAVASADIALNVLREQNLPDGTNMRTFEVPGAGGFLLSTRTSGADEIYPEGEAGAYFESRKELLNKIACFLEHDRERRTVARRAHEITARNHRYVHRARRILDTVGLPAP